MSFIIINKDVTYAWICFGWGYITQILFEGKESCCESITPSDSSDKSLDITKGMSFKIREGVGVLELPSCNLIAVQLGPSEDKKKAVLTLYLENKTSPHETFKPVSDLKTKKYVKLSPAYYATGITLESKGVPITAYYSSVL